MRVSSYSIPTRLYAGFGIVIALGAVLAGYGYVQLSTIEATTTRMNHLVENTVRILQADTMIEALRRAKTKVALDGDPKAEAEFKEKQPKIVDMMQDGSRCSRVGGAQKNLSRRQAGAD